MRRRAHYPERRELTSDELAQLAAFIDGFWPGRSVARVHVESNRGLIIDWAPGSGPVSRIRLPLEYLQRNTVPKLVAVPGAMAATTYRQDRSGEAWHIIPVNEHGPRGRSLCGEPRQGTRLSEMLAFLAPTPPEYVCQACLDHVSGASNKDTPDVRFSTTTALPSA